MEYGWNWTDNMWIYKKIPIDVWSPFHEAANEEFAHKRHRAMAETEDGKKLEKFVEHVTGCPRCKSMSRLCKTGKEQRAILDPMWQVWLDQLETAQAKGVRARDLYDAEFQGQLRRFGIAMKPSKPGTTPRSMATRSEILPQRNTEERRETQGRPTERNKREHEHENENENERREEVDTSGVSGYVSPQPAKPQEVT